tara:strand:- start:16374 stop:16787 length:414 start_codon:yes stop_codon:yes gene_type:complete
MMRDTNQPPPRSDTMSKVYRAQNGCILRVSADGESYIFSGGRTGQYSLSVEHTDEARLNAHWEGYLAVNEPIKYRVSYIRENCYREWNAKGEKVAKRRRASKTVIAANEIDAANKARDYCSKFYPQTHFSLVSVESA